VPDNIDELFDALMDTIPEIEPEAAEANEPKTLWRRISDCFWYCDSSVFMIIFGLFPLLLGTVIAEPYFGRTDIPASTTFEGSITKSIYLEANKTYTLYTEHEYDSPHCSIVDSKGNNLPAETWEPNEHDSFVEFYHDFEQVRPTKSGTYKFFCTDQSESKYKSFIIAETTAFPRLNNISSEICYNRIIVFYASTIALPGLLLISAGTINLIFRGLRNASRSRAHKRSLQGTI
jgi:hypothetical protein